MVASIFEAGRSSLSDYVAFQFRHGPYDCEHGAAHGGRGVQRLLMGNEVDFQGTELLQCEDKLFDAASEAIKSPDHNYVEKRCGGRPPSMHSDRVALPWPR